VGRRERRLVQTGAGDSNLSTTRGFQNERKRPGPTNSDALRGAPFEGGLDRIDGDQKHALETPSPEQHRDGDSDVREELEEGSLLRRALRSGLSAHGVRRHVLLNRKRGLVELELRGSLLLLIEERHEQRRTPHEELRGSLSVH